jgi:glucose-6-phosphate 1-epimerase
MAMGENPAVIEGAGEGGLRQLILTHPRGGRVEVYPHGAHVTSYRDAEGDELLFVSRESRFGGGAAIRGGVPVIFPQFADQGPLPKHGFARTAAWTLADQSADDRETRVVLRFEDSEETREIWDYAFRAVLAIRLGDALTMEMAVENTGDRAIDFTGALHTYFRVADVRRASVHGLAGTRFRDKVAGGAESVQAEDVLEIAGEVDRIYMGAPDPLRIRDEAGGRTIVLRRTGFADAVVWNPWIDLARNLPDLADDEYAKMLCVESANAAAPIRLAPGERWLGTQTIRRER